VILADTTASLVERVAGIFAARGVGGERIEWAARRPRRDYLDVIAGVDIALDPFPFNGHTTTCDALWQGVPVVTLSGRTYVSRYGASALATLDLHHLISHSLEQYMEVAIALANDAQRLANFRATLRARMAASPLLDFASFTRNLEAAYRQMWIAWCADS
jgi:protein O-GlcNAc transferase